MEDSLEFAGFYCNRCRGHSYELLEVRLLPLLREGKITRTCSRCLPMKAQTPFNLKPVKTPAKKSVKPAEQKPAPASKGSFDPNVKPRRRRGRRRMSGIR